MSKSHETEDADSQKISDANGVSSGNPLFKMRTWALIPRIALIYLSATSYISQYEALWTQKEHWDLSALYVLFNLIATTEQFALMTLIVFAPEYREGNVIQTPSRAHTWLNLLQSTVSWVNQLVLFVLYILFSSLAFSRKLGMIFVFSVFCIISVVPLIAIIHPPRTPGRTETQALLSAFDRLHLTLVSPLVTILRTLGCSFQLEFTGINPDLQEAIGWQSLLFYAVTVAWVLSFYVSGRIWRYSRPLRWQLGIWYKFVGWAAVDSFVFASVQGRIWVFVRGALHEWQSGSHESYEDYDYYEDY